MFRQILGRFLPLLAIALSIFGMILTTLPARAASFAPGCTGTTGDAAQLQADITTAGSNGAVDTIDLVAGCTYTLTATLTINADAGNLLTVNGNGATISGNDALRVFVVDSGANVSMNTLTITQGRTTTGNGGGILSNGTLALSGVTLSNNQAVNRGGGLHVASGSATVSGSQILNNRLTSGDFDVVGVGMGLTSGTLTVTGSTFTGNQSSFPTDRGYGGGLGVYDSGAGDATLNVSGSTFSGNEVFSGGGVGVLRITTRSSIVNISSSFFTGNTVGRWGGGVYATSNVTIVNSTFTGNRVIGGSGDAGGGAVYAETGGIVTISNSTLSANTAPRGSNLRISTTSGSSGSVTIYNSILANALNDFDCYKDGGSLTVRHSLIETQGDHWSTTCGVIDGANGNILGHDPDLGALNGNHYPLNSTSPAIDTGSNTLIPSGVTTDQLGAARIQGNSVDMGAVESAFVPVIVAINPGGTTTLNEGQPGATLTLSRTGDTTNPLTVALNMPIGGNLTTGDYSISGTMGTSGSMTATFAGGAGTTPITIAALADSVGAELDDSMTLTIIDTADYNVGSPNSATLFFPRNDLGVVHGNADGEGSLRYAILNANTFPGSDTITLPTGVTISSNTPADTWEESYLISESLTITGNNTQTVTGDTTGNERRVFTLNGTTTLQGFTITGTSASYAGAAVAVNSGSATLGTSGLPMMLVGNVLRYRCGAGLYVGYGSSALVQAGTHINGNNPGFDGSEYGNSGGGICSDGTVTVDGAGTQVNGNRASMGGGIMVNYGSLTVQNGATVDGNTALNDGGGIYLGFTDGTVTVQNGVSISNNTAGRGGGILQQYTFGAVTITGSIINRNVGGAFQIYSYGTTPVQVSNTCITGNSDTAVSYDYTEVKIDMTGNWWGSPLGPYSGQETPTPPNDANTMVSNGDSVTYSTDANLFDYSGYLTSPPAAIASSCLTCAEASSIAGARVCTLP